MSPSRFFCVCCCFSAVAACAARDDDVDSDDPDGDVFADHGSVDIAVRSGLRFNSITTFDGVTRAATADDVARLDGYDDELDDVVSVGDAFVVEREGVPQYLFSLHSVDADGDRRLLYRPVDGTRLTINLDRAGVYGSDAVVIEDDEGVVFAGTELVNALLPGAPAAVNVRIDDEGRTDVAPCGTRREALLEVDCGFRTDVRVNESREACGLIFTNVSSFVIDDGARQCDDSPEKAAWTAVRL